MHRFLWVALLAGAGLGRAAEAPTATDSGPSAPADIPQAEVQVVTPAYINSLAESLRRQRPALLAAEARVSAAEADVRAVRTWEDPKARVGAMLAEEEMRMEDGDLLYGIEQELPLFGRPRAARERAEASRFVALTESEYQFLVARRDLALALYRAALADRVVAIGEEDLAWIGAALSTVESLYQIGDAPQSQVLRLQNERSRRLTELVTARLRRDLARATLNRVLGVTNEIVWPRLELPAPAGEIQFSERLVGLSTRNEPRLQVMRSMAREAAASVAVARRGRHPRAMVGLGAQNYSGSGEFRQAMVELSFTIPWFNSGKYRAEIRREEDRRAAAEFDVADMELAVREETRALVVASEAARREARIYQEEIIPRSEQALASAESAWMTGKGMFLEVLEARRMLLDARLNLARAVADQYEALSELVLCCGLADLEALEMLGAEAPPGALSDLEREARPAAQISSGGPSPNSVPSTPSRTPAQP